MSENEVSRSKSTAHFLYIIYNVLQIYCEKNKSSKVDKERQKW